MRAAPLLIILTLVASGCVGDVPDAEAPATPITPAPSTERLSLPTEIAFAPPTLLGTRTGGVEPSIAAAPDGTLYVTTPLRLWRSDDGGKTWKEIGTPTCPQGLPECPGLESYTPGMKGAGDADIWVTPDGRVHWLGLSDGANAIPYQVSEDKGETWSDVVDLAGDDSGDREWITGRADGTLFANWRNFPAQGDPMIVMRASYDGGRTWTDATDIAPDTRQGGIAVDPTSTALALAHDPGGKIQVAHSFDNGTTWESVVVSDDPLQGHVFPVTAYDAEGNLYVAYAHDKDGVADQGGTIPNRPLETPALYLHVSKDKGLTWSPAVQVNAPGTTAWFPWIAAGAGGRVILVWYQDDLGLPRQASTKTYVMSGISLNADAEAPEFRLTRVAPEPVHRGPECRENPGVCTRSLLDFFEVAIHPDGYPVVTYGVDQETWPAPRVSVEVAYMSKGPDMLH